MKTYRYVEPYNDSFEACWTTITDGLILQEYYPYWSNRLKELERDHLINNENCIDDFIAIHFAFEMHKEINND